VITFDLPRDKRARIWLVEPENYRTHAISTREFLGKPRAYVHKHRRSIVAEMFVPGGARFEYGLLGARVVNGGAVNDEILVTIPVTGSSEPLFADSLAGRLDTVRWGLPAEYVEAVVSGAQESLLTYGAPAGRIIEFAWAAHGYMSSNNHRFRRLAALLIRLLITPDDVNLEGLVREA